MDPIRENGIPSLPPSPPTDAKTEASNKYPTPESYDKTWNKIASAVMTGIKKGEANANAATAGLALKSPKETAPNMEKAASDSNGTLESAEAAPSTKNAKKRKATDDAATDSLSPKRPKRTAPRTKKAVTPSPPKSKRKRKDSKKDTEADMPPPPPPQATLTPALISKINQVKTFLKAGNLEDSKLDRDPKNENIIYTPEEILVGALMRMRLRWEIGSEDQASVADTQEAIVAHYSAKHSRPALAAVPVLNCVILDVSKVTNLESGIHSKIFGHGLEGISLLEIELEMHWREYLRWHRPVNQDEDDKYNSMRFMNSFETIWKTCVDHDEHLDDRLPSERLSKHDGLVDDGPAGEATVDGERNTILGGEGKSDRVDACIAPGMSVRDMLMTPPQSLLSY